MIAIVNGKLQYNCGKGFTEFEVDPNKIIYPYFNGVLIQESNYLTNITGKQISIELEETILYVLISDTLKPYMVTENSVYSLSDKILDYTLPSYCKIFDEHNFSYYDGHILYIDGHEYNFIGSLNCIEWKQKYIRCEFCDIEKGIYVHEINYDDMNYKEIYYGFGKNPDYRSKNTICGLQMEDIDDIFMSVVVCRTVHGGAYYTSHIYNKITNMLDILHCKKLMTENSYQILSDNKTLYSKSNDKRWYFKYTDVVEILDPITYSQQPKSARS
jgi:hypothetical protein